MGLAPVRGPGPFAVANNWSPIRERVRMREGKGRGGANPNRALPSPSGEGLGVVASGDLVARATTPCNPRGMNMHAPPKRGPGARCNLPPGDANRGARRVCGDASE